MGSRVPYAACACLASSLNEGGVRAEAASTQTTMCTPRGQPDKCFHTRARSHRSSLPMASLSSALLGLRSSGLTVFAASCLRIMLLSSACSPMLLRTVPCNPVYAATGVHCSLFSHAAPKSRTVVMRALSPSSYFHHDLGSVMCRSICFGVVSSWLSISWDGGFLVFVHVDAGYE